MKVLAGLANPRACECSAGTTATARTRQRHHPCGCNVSLTSATCQLHMQTQHMHECSRQTHWDFSKNRVGPKLEHGSMLAANKQELSTDLSLILSSQFCIYKAVLDLCWSTGSAAASEPAVYGSYLGPMLRPGQHG